MAKRPRPQLTLMKRSPVLITESAEKFSRLHDALKDDFKPRGTIEVFKVKDMAVLMWEISRCRRTKRRLSILPFALLYKAC